MHCSTDQGKLHSPLFSVALQNRLTAGLGHCNYTYRDLLFIQVCSDPTAMQCSTGQINWVLHCSVLLCSRQTVEQAQQLVAHDDFGLGTDVVAQAAAHPLSAPFSELITYPLHHLRPPPALQDVRGEWAYIHKPGVGTMAIAPPSASPSKKLAAAQALQQLRYGSTSIQVHQGLPVYNATAGAATSVAAGPPDSVAQALTGQFDATQPKKAIPIAENISEH